MPWSLFDFGFRENKFLFMIVLTRQLLSVERMGLLDFL